MSDELDFTKDDQGKYRHPEFVGGFLYKDLEDRVFKALDSGYRTLSRIKKFAKLEPGFDLSWVIDGMEMDELIRRVDNGTITAFFRFGTYPRRFWLTGDGTVGVEFDEEFKPSTAEKQNLAQERNPGYLFANDRDRRSSARGGSQVIDVDVDRLRELMTEHGTVKAAAEHLGLGYSTLTVKLSQSPDLKKAADEGRTAYTERTGIKRQKRHTEAFQTEIPPETFRKYAAAGKSAEDLARDFDLALSTVYNRMEKPENLAAWKAGKLERSAAKHGAEPTPISGRRAYKKHERRSDNGGNMPRGHAVTIDHQTLKQASETLSNIKEIAAAFGIGQPALSRRLKHDAALRDIYDAGRQAYFAANGKTMPSRLSTDRARKPRSRKQAVTKVLGHEVQPKEPVIDVSLRRSVKSSPTKIVMELDERDLPAVAPTPGNPSLVTLSNGSQIALGFSGNFFGLTAGERQMMNAIAEIVDAGISNN